MFFFCVDVIVMHLATKWNWITLTKFDDMNIFLMAMVTQNSIALIICRRKYKFYAIQRMHTRARCNFKRWLHIFCTSRCGLLNSFSHTRVRTHAITLICSIYNGSIENKFRACDMTTGSCMVYYATLFGLLLATTKAMVNQSQPLKLCACIYSFIRMCIVHIETMIERCENARVSMWFIMWYECLV